MVERQSMRLTDYLLLGALTFSGCAEAPKRQTVAHETIEDEFDTPQPKVNIRAHEAIMLTPNSALGLTIEDHSKKRFIRDVAIYFIPAGKDLRSGVRLDISGSTRELETNGKAVYCWHVGKQFSQIPEGPGIMKVYIVGRETGMCEIPIVFGKYDDSLMR